MPKQILLNFFLALLWMFLTVNYSLTALIIGYLLGLGLLFMMRRFFKERFYLERVWAVIVLFFIFQRELLLSNIQVLMLVLRPRLTIKPAIFALETDLKEDWEITLLSSLITLTPGTLVIDVSHDQKTLYIHALDVSDIDEAIHSIKTTFEKAIIEVSRP
ncbi:Na+/H+ antiporter subunit E [Pueribacillus theae]|uniref:Na+/H+ antiporter subunit E n=1 Tax=Pueribacillus theae TaxID=2171751 RepID=A0A2U1K6C6_9BACI|nr:Na+/H+ antiporter subunit E [Pueribacillus theae]PWA12754.1 Na+/H+ antiporter subunit E [Pueribacillus theae]